MKLARFFCVFSRSRVLLRACFGAASGESITHEQSCFRKKNLSHASKSLARYLKHVFDRTSCVQPKKSFSAALPPPLNYARSTDRLDF